MFGQFIQAGPLLDEHNPDAPQGGGEPAAPAIPPFDPAAFHANLKKELLTEIRKDINGIDKNYRKQAEAQQQYLDGKFTDLFARFEKPADPPADPAPSDPPAAPPTPPAPAPTNPPPAQPVRHTPSPSELALQKKVAEMESAMKKQQELVEKANREAAKKDKQSALKTEISKHQFASPQDPLDLYDLLENKIEKDESDGHYYGPEGVTLDEFVKSQYAARPNWHPARPVGGAGAPASSALPSNSKVFDMDMIRPGMTKEEKDRARAVIQQFGSGTIL